MSYGIEDLARLRPQLHGAFVGQLLPAGSGPSRARRPNLSIEEVTPETRYLVANMLPLANHDGGAFGHFGNNPSPHAVPGGGLTDRTLAEMSDHHMRGWSERPEAFHPLLVMVGERPAGFAVVEAPSDGPAGVQYYLSSFFLHHRFREPAVQDCALRLVLDRYRGAWEIDVHPQDRERHDTVQRVLTDYLPRGYRSGRDVCAAGGRATVGYRFDNSE